MGLAEKNIWGQNLYLLGFLVHNLIPQQEHCGTAVYICESEFRYSVVYMLFVKSVLLNDC